MSVSDDRLSWRPNEWLKICGHPFSRTKLYQEIQAGKIDARKSGGNTLILMPPRAYLESLPKELKPAWGTPVRVRKAKAAAA
jgi:hypothetical protein